MSDFTLARVLAARHRITGVADATPLVPSSLDFGHELLLKLEIALPIGACKLRGAVSAISAVPVGVPGVT
ncbi:MAG: hydroxyectoine utilization dehydratase EutB, partial [Pseudomonadota bacterium]